MSKVLYIEVSFVAEFLSDLSFGERSDTSKNFEKIVISGKVKLVLPLFLLLAKALGCRHTGSYLS